MNIETIRNYCLGKKGTITEELPFGDDTLVFKLFGKMFFLASMGVRPVQFNVKCDPERAIELRERYPAVRPGYHMDKKHWNTIVLDGSLSSNEIFAMIDHSYDLVAQGLKKSFRDQILSSSSKRK